MGGFAIRICLDLMAKWALSRERQFTALRSARRRNLRTHWNAERQKNTNRVIERQGSRDPQRERPDRAAFPDTAAMSALPRRADIVSAAVHVRSVPITEVGAPIR
jgi:hypothetical protein